MASDNDFERVDRSDKPLYGPRKLVLCGFAAEVQSKFAYLLEMLGLKDLPLVWAVDEHADHLVGELVTLPDGSGAGMSSMLPRAIVVAGVREKELHQLMAGCRQAGMRPPLWAVLTTTSESWPLKKLLAELVAERDALQKAKPPNA
jgi:hypothetical protein